MNSPGCTGRKYGTMEEATSQEVADYFQAIQIHQVAVMTSSFSKGTIHQLQN